MSAWNPCWKEPLVPSSPRAMMSILSRAIPASRNRSDAFLASAQGDGRPQERRPEGWPSSSEESEQERERDRGPFAGVCSGIDERGALIIETPTGPEICFGGVVEKFE